MKELSTEDKELIFKDLSQRLPYKVKCEVYERTGTLVGLTDYGAEIDYGNGEDTTCEIKYCKPFLRPMSSMTEEERKQYYATQDVWQADYCAPDYIDTLKTYDWFNKNHFDYRGLIPMDLAIEVTEENNPYK